MRRWMDERREITSCHYPIQRIFVADILDDFVVFGAYTNRFHFTRGFEFKECTIGF
jgi:hypothetical protein